MAMTIKEKAEVVKNLQEEVASEICTQLNNLLALAMECNVKVISNDWNTKTLDSFTINDIDGIPVIEYDEVED